MKRKHSIACLLLVLLLAAQTLASCGSSETPETTPDTTPTETMETETETIDPNKDSLPEGLDYEGYDFRVLTYENGNLGHAGGWSGYFDINETTGEVLNDAAFTRNAEVEERLNIGLTCIEQGQTGDVMQNLYTSVMAGEDAYDYVIAQFCDGYFNPKTLTIVRDVKRLPYIDLTKGYYHKSIEETFTVQDKLYFLGGDYVTSLFSSSYIFYNIDLWKEYALPDPYEIVLSGDWTYDKCLSMIEGTYVDENGDGKKDNNDRFGIVSCAITIGYNFHSGGGKLFSLTKDGYELPVTSERNIAILESIVDAMTHPDIHVFTDLAAMKNAFFNGQAILYFSGNSITTLRDAEFTAGILPFPKYDEAQENYVSVLAGGLTVVPSTISDPERTGAIIEALYSASAHTIKDAFIQQYVENKVLQDEGSQQMYRLNYECGQYDFGRYLGTKTAVSDRSIINDLLNAKSTGLVSKWESVQAKTEAVYDEFFADMSGLE